MHWTTRLLVALCLVGVALGMSHGGGGMHGGMGSGSMGSKYRKAYRDQKEVLNDDPDVVLQWKCDMAKNKVHFKASGKTNGWVGIGIGSPGDSGMTNTDIATGGMHNGYVCCKDMWASSNGRPTVDASQDLKYVSVKGKNGWVEFQFSRYRKNFMASMSAPMEDRAIVEGETVRVTWAVGAFDPNEHCKISKHMNTGRGQKDGLVLCANQDLSGMTNLGSGVDIKWGKDKGYLTVEISAMTGMDDWVGFGFSPDGTMVGADMFIGYIKMGMVYLQDRFSTVQQVGVVPSVDMVNNWKLADGSYMNGKLTIRATRCLRGDGSKQDMKIRSKMNVIWAKGSMSGSMLQQHGKGGGDRGKMMDLELFPMPTIQDLMDKIYDRKKH